MLGVIGKKLGMTQRFNEAGQSVPVTVVEAGPCTVVEVRTVERDGYDALQLGFGTRREKRLSKAQRGHMAKGGRSDFATLVEFRLDSAGDYEIGQTVTAGQLFAAGDKVDVTGTSKGKGFAGVMKKYNFAGQSATHGTHESFRGAGSIGACAYPGRVFKGKRMAGRMGGERTTIQNLEVVEVREDENLVLIRGAVPGANNGGVVVKPAVKTPSMGSTS